MSAGVNEMYGNRLLYQQGAVPMMKDGVFLGAGVPVIDDVGEVAF